MDFKSIQDVKLDYFDTCVCLMKTYSVPMKVNIPKLMPMIPVGEGKVEPSPITLSDGCIINSSECKPSFSKQINGQNFITLPASKLFDEDPPVPDADIGRVFTFTCMNGDFRKAKLITI